MKIKRKIRYWLLTVSLLLVIISSASFLSPTIFVEEDQIARPAPINEDFLEYLKEPTSERWRKYSETGYAFGLRPSPLDFSYFKDFPVVKVQDLPATHDLRTEGKLTPVKNQGNCGSCWAFASYGSLESFLMPSESRDFSEQNLIDRHGFDWEPCDGGDIFMSTAYLARWSGPVNEKDDPYVFSNLDGFKIRKHVQEVACFPRRSNSSDNDLLKQAVMTYGAVYASMYYSNNCYNATYKSYYNTSREEGAHAVAIVGWDNNFDKNKFNTIPPGNGAFIVRNSWGKNWGESGYFYVSYYDNYFAKKGISAAITAEPPTCYSVIYQYDKLGWTTSLGYGSDTAWFANIFTATSSYPLLAVSFYAAASSNEYEIYVYKDVKDGQPRSGILARKQTGSLNSLGYFTVPLKVGVSLVPGQKFSVVVKLKTKNYNYPLPVEYPFKGYSSRAKANVGESFISNNGDTWSDLHTSWDGRFANTNVCLKAFAGFPPVYPPKNFMVQRVENNYIFFREYINKLSWEANPDNRTEIKAYRLYRKRKGASDESYELVDELNADIFTYEHRGLKKDELFSYRITSVDEYVRESEPTEVSN